ncbi:uncharacterized protein LOC134242029 [Saccostrea cucullata]|uniref:uncharacterized protein LOC134242029 n=1 Tax=Saccostrea cuccullata TaxID=36930 RepID=UPI002ED27C15
MRAVHRILEKYDYSCGSEIVPDGFENLNICVRMQLNCNSPIEFPYYAENNTLGVNKTICCHCAGEQAERDKETLKKFRTVLPICAQCKRSEKVIIKRNPI